MEAPDNIASRIEGGPIHSPSRHLKDEVRFDTAAVLPSDWTGHPILAGNEAPNPEVRLIDRRIEPCHGTGEISQFNTGAVVANALFDAVGSRDRRFPLTPDRVKAAMNS